MYTLYLIKVLNTPICVSFIKVLDIYIYHVFNWNFIYIYYIIYLFEVLDLLLLYI